METVTTDPVPSEKCRKLTAYFNCRQLDSTWSDAVLRKDRGSVLVSTITCFSNTSSHHCPGELNVISGEKPVEIHMQKADTLVPANTIC